MRIMTNMIIAASVGWSYRYWLDGRHTLRLWRKAPGNRNKEKLSVCLPLQSTAEKVSQALERVPASIAVLDELDIEQTGVHQLLRDISKAYFSEKGLKSGSGLTTRPYPFPLSRDFAEAP